MCLNVGPHIPVWKRRTMCQPVVLFLCIEAVVCSEVTKVWDRAQPLQQSCQQCLWCGCFGLDQGCIFGANLLTISIACVSFCIRGWFWVQGLKSVLQKCTQHAQTSLGIQSRGSKWRWFELKKTWNMHSVHVRSSAATVCVEHLFYRFLVCLTLPCRRYWIWFLRGVETTYWKLGSQFLISFSP